jgi:23S rRNA pseudouridine1911/1915/1917 synthase
MRQYSFCTLTTGERLDKLLVHLFPTLSRSFIQELIAQEKVLLNKKAVLAHTIPRKKDLIEIVIPSLQKTGIVPADIPLDILYEDKDLIILNKQAGIVVHPSDNGGHVSDSIVNALLYHRPSDFSLKGTNRPGIVHRLDKDTSGILLIAKHEQAMRYMTEQWQNRTVFKEYKALVTGRITPQTGIIEAPVGRSLQNRKEMAIRIGKGGRYAQTDYQVEQYYHQSSLLSVHISTGRTHQIRVHFKSIGHPVLGDQTYGNAKWNDIFRTKYGLQRQFLHAYKLRFIHPMHKKQMEVIAPLAFDLQVVLKKLSEED